MARRKRPFLGNQIMRDLTASHPKYPTGLHLWRAVHKGATFMDTGADCIKFATKFPEFNRNMVGFVMEHSSWSGESYGPVTLTGWHIFTYSGRGAANECTLTDGRIAWLSDLRLPKGVELPTPVEPFVPPPEQLTERTGLFFGVRIPRSIRFFDVRTLDDKHCFRRTPIEPLDLGNTKLIDGEWQRVPHIIADLGDQEYIATLFGFKPYGGGHSMAISTTHYTDTRQPWAAHWAADFMMDIRKRLAEYWRAYRKDRSSNRCRPLWVEFNNYGHGIEVKFERSSQAA